MNRREVRIHCRLRSPHPPEDELAAFLLDLMGHLGVEGEVGVRLASDRTVAEANSRYRGRRGPTDVLSFPSGQALEDGTPYLGDILVGMGKARKAAEEAGKPLPWEVKRLLLHGLLHLLGYDHETDGGRMERKERRLRRRWGLSP
ncbi:MAG: rRNA maturation RNase YbeY [Acidobacteriota bacterium]